MRWLGLLVVLNTFALTARATCEPPNGPIATRNHRSFSLAFLRFEPRGDVLKPGERQWDFGFTIANEARARGNTINGYVLEDFELWRLAATYRQSLKADLEAWGEVSWVYRGGGILDPMIDWWHETILGWSDAYRNGRPFGNAFLQTPYAEYGRTTTLGDTTLGLRKRLSPKIIGSAAIKLPTGPTAQLVGSGGVDLGASLDVQQPLGQGWQFDGQVAAVAQGKSKEKTLRQRRPNVGQVSLAISKSDGGKSAWVLQWQSEDSALKTGIAESDDWHRTATLGYRRNLSERRQIEVYLTEDFDVFPRSNRELLNIGVDFTLGFRYRITL